MEKKISFCILWVIKFSYSLSVFFSGWLCLLASRPAFNTLHFKAVMFMTVKFELWKVGYSPERPVLN